LDVSTFAFVSLYLVAIFLKHLGSRILNVSTLPHFLANEKTAQATYSTLFPSPLD